MKKLTIVALCVLLAGCGDNEINAVKEMYIDGYIGYTYGKVLDNHKVCESSEWKSYTENDVKKVSYTCSLKKGKTAFNWDEKEAKQIREKGISEFTERYKKSANGAIEGLQKQITINNDKLSEINAMINKDNYFAYFPNVDKVNDWHLEDIVSAMSEASRDDGPVSELIYKLAGMPSFASSTSERLVSVYLAKVKEGLTKEDEEAFKIINEEIRKRVKNNFSFRIKQANDEIARDKESIEKFKQRLDDKAEIQKQAAKAGEEDVVRYGMSHYIDGKEILTWAWNPALERYDVEYRFTRRHQYKDNYTNHQLSVEKLINSAAKNISNIDSYMPFGR